MKSLICIRGAADMGTLTSATIIVLCRVWIILWLFISKSIQQTSPEVYTGNMDESLYSMTLQGTTPITAGLGDRDSMDDTESATVTTSHDVTSGYGVVDDTSSKPTSQSVYVKPSKYVNHGKDTKRNNETTIEEFLNDTKLDNGQQSPNRNVTPTINLLQSNKTTSTTKQGQDFQKIDPTPSINEKEQSRHKSRIFSTLLNAISYKYSHHPIHNFTLPGFYHNMDTKQDDETKLCENCTQPEAIVKIRKRKHMHMYNTYAYRQRFYNYRLLYNSMQDQHKEHHPETTEFYAWVFGGTMVTLGSLTTMASCFVFCLCGDRWRQKRTFKYSNKDFSYERVDSLTSVVTII